MQFPSTKVRVFHGIGQAGIADVEKQANTFLEDAAFNGRKIHSIQPACATGAEWDAEAYIVYTLTIVYED